MSTQIQTKVLSTGQHIYYSLVQKQSESNIMFNERLLILVQENYIGYTKDYNKKDLENSINLEKIKKKVSIQNLRRVLQINKNVTIMINQYDKFNKLKSVKWLFRMQNQKLAETWTQLLKRQNSPLPSRKTTEQKENKQKQFEVGSDKKSTSIKQFVKQQEALAKKQQQIRKNNQLMMEKMRIQKQKQEKQKQKQRQLQKQREKEREIQKQKERERQRQREKQKQRQQQKQRQSLTQKQQKQKSHKLNNAEKIQFILQKQKEKNKQQNPVVRSKIPQQKLIPKQKQYYKSGIDSYNSPNANNNNPNQLRSSEKTFTFKQNYSDDAQIYSPPKRQAKINTPHPVMEKIKKIDSNLASHLEQKVDLKAVQNQLKNYKKSNNLNINPNNNDNKNKNNNSQFRQLSQFLTNRQKQIQQTSFKNYFRQPLSTLNDQKFQDFYCFCQLKIQQLLLQNFNNQKSTLNWVQHISNKNGIKVIIIPTELKQIPGNNNICDEGLLKKYLNMIKNMDYIWKVITNDQVLMDVFLMPMSCLVQLQGVVVYFTCLFTTQEQNNQAYRKSSKSQDFSQFFEHLSAQTKISKNILQNTNCIKFTKYTRTINMIQQTQQDYEQNKTLTQFIISEVSQFLPRLTSINCQIRPEMFSQIAQQLPNPNSNNNTSSSMSSRFEHSNINNSGRYNESYNKRISKKQSQYQAKQFKQPIQDTINLISKNLDKLEEYVIHPSQFSQLMHLYGLNMVYLSDIYKKVQNAFTKSIIKTQVFLRSFKTIYRKKMQQTLISVSQLHNQNKKKSPKNQTSQQQSYPQQGQEQSQTLTAITKSLLNILLSKKQHEQTAQLWSIVTLHSQINFKLPVQRQEINKGYLFLGLEHHLGLKLQTVYNSCDKIFMVDTFVNQLQFIPKVKPCQLYWINQKIYNLPLNQAANSLINQLELKTKQIPFHIYQNKNIVEKIYQIISLYHNPSSSIVRHLQIYKDAQSSSELTLFYFRRKIAQIKWLIKNQAQLAPILEQSLPFIQTKLQQLKQSLYFYFGSYHPFYSQIYDILINLHKSFNNYNQSQQNLKQSLTNTLQLCGGNTLHIKLANNYYQRGQFYQHEAWCKLKIDQAINNYKKAKNILEVNQYTRRKQYAVVNMKLAGLYLYKGKDNDCWRILVAAVQIFCNILGIDITNSSNLSKIQSKPTNYSISKPKSNNVEQKQDNQQSDIQALSTSQQLQLYKNIYTCIQLLFRCNSQQSNPTQLLSYSLSILQQTLSPTYQPLSLTPPAEFPDTLTISLLKIAIQIFFRQHQKQITQQFLNYTQIVCDQCVVGAANDPNQQLEFIKEFVINGGFLECLAEFSTKSKVLLEMFYKNKTKFVNSNSKYKNKENRKIADFQALIKAIVVVFGEGFLFGVLNSSIN